MIFLPATLQSNACWRAAVAIYAPIPGIIAGLLSYCAHLICPSRQAASSGYAAQPLPEQQRLPWHELLLDDRLAASATQAVGDKILHTSQPVPETASSSDKARNYSAAEADSPCVPAHAPVTPAALSRRSRADSMTFHSPADLCILPDKTGRYSGSHTSPSPTSKAGLQALFPQRGLASLHTPAHHPTPNNFIRSLSPGVPKRDDLPAESEEGAWSQSGARQPRGYRGPVAGCTAVSYYF